MASCNSWIGKEFFIIGAVKFSLGKSVLNSESYLVFTVFIVKGIRSYLQ